MSLRESVSDRALDLPPPFALVALRERGDAFAHAQAIAAEQGAGTLVWVRRFDLAEFAVVLEPEEPLGIARRAFFAGMNALADALAAHGPPEKPVAFDWPDAVRFDGVLVGGGRLAWPVDAADSEVPDWLVFGAMVRMVALRAGEPGMRPLNGSLEEVGFEDPDAGEILQSFARLLMGALHDWQHDGFAKTAERYVPRLTDADALPGRPRASGTRPEDPHWSAALGTPVKPDCDTGRGAARIDSDAGDLILPGGQRRFLAQALRQPSWLNPETGTPWL